MLRDHSANVVNGIAGAEQWMNFQKLEFIKKLQRQ